MQVETLAFRRLSLAEELARQGPEYTTGALRLSDQELRTRTSWLTVNYFRPAKPVYYTITREPTCIPSA